MKSKTETEELNMKIITAVRSAARKIRRLLQRLAVLFCRGEGCFYINGAEVLPAPLSAEEEADTVSRLPGELS